MTPRLGDAAIENYVWQDRRVGLGSLQHGLTCLKVKGDRYLATAGGSIAVPRLAEIPSEPKSWDNSDQKTDSQVILGTPKILAGNPATRL